MWGCISAIILAIIILRPATPAGQRKSPLSTGTGTGVERQVDTLRNYWGDLNAFYYRQAEAALDQTERILIRHPPRLPEPQERRLALLTIDTVLHDPKAPERPAVQEFFRRRRYCS